MTAAGAAARGNARTVEDALSWFDGLAPVELEAMWGMWRGEGFASGHPMDGLLEACRWHGKRFDDAERVHPLVFDAPGGGTLNVRPVGVRLALWLVARWPALKSPAVGRVVQAGLPLLRTRRPRARLRLLQHRGVLTAAMLYDDLPIVDVFRRVDADTVLGLMDMRGMAQPFFFLLRRERPAAFAPSPSPSGKGLG